MRQPPILLASLLAVQVASQASTPPQSTTATTQDALSSFLSSYSSFFDSITRTFATSSPTESSNSVTATSSASSSSTRSSVTVTSTGTSSTRQRSSQQTDSSVQSNTPTISSQAEPAATSGTSISPTSGSSSSNRDRIIAIAVGSVLGALALGLFILLLIIIFDRRRHRRNARRKGSVASASEEALASRNRPTSNTAPAAIAAPHSRNQQPVDQRGNARMPLMSERSNLDESSVLGYRNDYNVPYTSRTGDGRQSSSLLPSQSHDSARTDDRFTSGTGLNNHPYQDSRYTGSTLPVSTGSAALGAAAAGRPLADDDNYDLRRPADYGPPYPASWSEPPAQATKRTSMAETGRRSENDPRGRSYDTRDYAENPPRDETSLAEANREVGAVTRARQSRREYGRSLPTDPLLPEQQTDRTATSSISAMSTPRNSRGKRVSAYQSLPQDVPATDLPSRESGSGTTGTGTTSTLVPYSYEPSVDVAIGETGVPTDTRSRIPPSLTIPNPNLRRSRLSRGSKRARFASGDTYHEPVLYEQDRVSEGISPPGTARSTNFGSTSRRLSAGTAGTAETEELVSPVSPDSMTRGVGRSVSMTHGRASFLNAPRARAHSPHRIKRRPVSDISFRVSPPTSESNSIPGDDAPTTRRPRPRSGLVTAVRDHFNLNQPQSQPQPRPVAQTPTYQAYRPPETIRPSALPPIANTDSTASTTMPQKPITRKPVPRSRYSGWKPLPQLPTDSSGGATRENWWREHDDPAFA